MQPRHDSYYKPSDWVCWNFHQKIRWRCKHPSPAIDYGLLVDKYRVKDFVRPYFPVAETYQVIRKPNEIDRKRLPASYVMKATHSWNRCMLVVDGRFEGMNRDRKLVGKYANNIYLRILAFRWLWPGKFLSREVHYRYVRPGILFEEFIDPVDYELQLFLFSGICRMTMVLKRGFYHRQGTVYRLYDQNWCRLKPGSEDTRSIYDDSLDETPRPGREDFAALRRLCKHMDHVRVDFFVSNGRLYFSEFTFTHNAGKPSLLGRYETELSYYWPDVKAI